MPRNVIVVPDFEIWHSIKGGVTFGKTGDFFLCHRSGVASRTIGFGQRLRNKTRPYSYWTHCGVFVNDLGDIVEALTRGVSEDHIESYRYIPYVVIHFTDLYDPDKYQMMDYVESTVGDSYNWLEIIASAINMVTGSSVSLGVDGHQICSGLVASTLIRAGAIMDMSADHVTPADLGRYFDVRR